MTTIDFNTRHRRAWLAQWHSKATEQRIRVAGWLAVLVFIVLGAAR